MATPDVVALWRGLDTSKGPFVLDGDGSLLKAYGPRKLSCNYTSFKNFVADPNFGNQSNNAFHLGLLPAPYAGNIQRARVFILALNPGFDPCDYYAESVDADFRRSSIKSLRQEFNGEEFPMICLNPRYAWHPGFRYWTTKFRDLLTTLAEKRGVDYTEALRTLSTEVACLEYVPYHSRGYYLPLPVLKSMASPEAIRRFVHESLIDRAMSGDIAVIVTRKSVVWGLSGECKNIVVYNQSEARGAHLTMKSRGGRKIADFLGL